MTLLQEIQEFIDNQRNLLLHIYRKQGHQITRCSDDPTELLERVKIELIRLSYNDNWAKQQDELLYKLLTGDKK